MEYVITSERPFDEIEALTRGALERHGFRVEQTFSLHSATGAAAGQGWPAYSVLMLYGPGAGGPLLGLVSLYRRGAQTVLSPVLSPPAGGDVDAQVVGALLLGELEVCVGTAGGAGCIDLAQTEEETDRP